MKCEIVTGNMPQLWEDLLSQLHEKEYPSESIRHGQSRSLHERESNP